MSEKKKHLVWKEPAFLVGVALTVGISAFFAYSLVCLPVITEEQSYFSKWAYLKGAPPNEIGDTLAGVAGSFAFVWIVVTVWLQAAELREQRTEFEKMANAQDKQADLLMQQGDIFRHEQKQRAEDRALDEALEIVRLLRQKLNSKPVFWGLSDVSRGSRGLFASANSEDSDQAFFEAWLKNNQNALSALLGFFEEKKIGTRPDKTQDFLPTCYLLARLGALQSDLSPAGQRKLERLGVQQVKEIFDEFNDADIW